MCPEHHHLHPISPPPPSPRARARLVQRPPPHPPPLSAQTLSGALSSRAIALHSRARRPPRCPSAEKCEAIRVRALCGLKGNEAVDGGRVGVMVTRGSRRPPVVYMATGHASPPTRRYHMTPPPAPAHSAITHSITASARRPPFASEADVGRERLPQPHGDPGGAEGHRGGARAVAVESSARWTPRLQIHTLPPSSPAALQGVPYRL